MGGKKNMGQREQRRRPVPNRTVDSSSKDRISELPNVIIASILTRLSIKDAATTCVLSKRWRYMWTYVTCFNLDIQTVVANRCHELLRTGKECEHVPHYKLFTQFLRLHQGTLDEFTISVSPVGKYRALCPALLKLIPDWIELALRKGVQNLEVDLYKYKLDHRGTLAKPFENPYPASCIKYLKHLSLNCLGVSGELVEHVLSNGCLLEHLSISRSKALRNLKVFGSSSLKFLQISGCKSLDVVEISAPSLVSFVYDICFIVLIDLLESKPRILLKHAPCLVNLSYSPMHVNDVISVPACTRGFLCFSSFLHQLETLNLGCRDYGVQWIRDMVLPKCTVLTSLKSLSLKFGARPFEETLLDMVSWIEISPFLRSFTLEISWQLDMPSSLNQQMQKLKRRPHQCLKVVKFCGFMGCKHEIELAKCLIENAMVLEKILIEPAKKWPFWDPKKKNIKRAIRHAQSQLQRKLPPGAKLCIL